LEFTLTVATSADGFIATASDDSPESWASAEEQALFLADVEAADWSVMGRNTHLAADRPDRRRIIFSATQPAGWHRKTQLWLDPAGLMPTDLPALVAAVYPLRKGLILGGTRVHDWFLARKAIARVHLTVEPVRFGRGLPVFTNQSQNTPDEVFASAGFKRQSVRLLNDSGTRYSVWLPKDQAR